MAAEVGAMNVTEQVDAIRALWADPAKKLVLPRVLASIIVMPLLWRRKRFLGKLLHSEALEEDGVGNLACGWMAFILLVSLLLQRQGLWWADPAASAILGIFIAREGLEAWERARR